MGSLKQMKELQRTVRDIELIISGRFELSCSEPLTEVKDLIRRIESYSPIKKYNILARTFAIYILKIWERDLLIGQCKK